MNRLINMVMVPKDVFVPEWIMVRKELSPGEKLCYASISAIAYKGNDVSRQGIANLMGTSIRQVDRYIKRLQELKLIKVEQVGLQQTNKYHYLEHEWMNDEG
jgi:transcription initiation factor IIE alpha subunit